MKKTIIALTLSTVFAAPAFSAAQTEYVNIADIANNISKAVSVGDVQVKEISRGKITVVTEKAGNGKTIDTAISANGDGTYTVNRDGNIHQVEVNSGGDIIKIDGHDAAVEKKEFDDLPDIHPSDDKVNEIIDDGTSRNHGDDINDNKNRIDDAASEYNRDAKSAQNWAAQAEQQFKQEIGRLDNKIDTVEGRVSNGAAMTGAMSQMQFGHSGLGVGAGVSNFNGSNAIAVGVGYAFGNEKQWMAKGSLGYAKSNKGSGSEDTMAAAGLTYSFN
ncbi:YadA C-terminal domain-containing protein [Vibrio splendidus]|uniref:YadA C-terminal domain-containing protein n=1 Tax=Vibrio splendidus TaxID=29497 RepID=UPI000C81C114|nr:YadA C-terminal domain-containing protein [Vibrio splendidus]PMI80535.1 hypothetical protein BCU37_02375 [Vibrio splendidus]PMK60942.1 hypothetical protein BCT96_01735 [Vibrio splendidus]